MAVQVSKNYYWFVVSLTVFLFSLVLVLIWPYLNSIILGSVLAVVFFPFYKKILLFCKSKFWSALIITFLILIFILIPLTVLGSLVFQETRQFYISFGEQGDFATKSYELIRLVNEKINRILPVSFESVDVTEYLRKLIRWLVSNFGSIFSNVAYGLANFALGLLAVFYFLKNSQEIKEAIFQYSPFDYQQTQTILKRARESIRAVIGGSLILAICQGIVAGLGFTLFKVPNPALWGGVTVIAALVPMVGTTLIVLPAVLYLVFWGNLVNALGLAVWGILAVGLVDNLLASHLMKRGVKLPPLLVLFSVLGGINFFGFMGFVIGPLIFTLFFLMLDICKILWRNGS